MKQSRVGGKETVSREKKEVGDNQSLWNLRHLHEADLGLRSHLKLRSCQITKDSGCTKKLVAVYLLSHQQLHRMMFNHSFQHQLWWKNFTFYEVILSGLIGKPAAILDFEVNLG